MAKPRLITKKNETVVAYVDTALFHVAKGGDPDANPYGIVPSSYSNPFILSFDSSNLTISIAGGILSIYGRQIELTTSTQVFDFHSTAESQKMFCTVFVEANLEDSTAQTVTIKLDISGASYRNFKTTGTQDNLYKLSHGVFQAPINHFIYTPSASEPFSDYEMVMKTYPEEARASTVNLRNGDSINGTKVSSLTETFSSGSSLRLRFVHASNEEALTIYKNLPRRSTSSPGYSKATEAHAIGTHDDATSIDSSITGITTIKRIKLMDMTNNFAGANMNVKSKITVDWDHLQSVRIWLKNPYLKGRMRYYEKEIATSGAQMWASPDIYECLNMTSDFWFSQSEISLNGVHISIEGSWSSWGFGDINGTCLIIRSGYDTSHNDGFLQIYGIPITAYQGSRHILAHLFIERDGDNTYFRAQGIPDTQEYNQLLVFPNWAWWRYYALDEIESRGEMWADFIYKGDVRL